MAILTKFLQLLKPERNDYVDVEKHLSENYDKIDTKMEELSNSNDEKLNKGAVSSEYDTAKKIEDKIKGIDEKFKNFCPFPVGSVLQMWNETNPTSLYLGTTWELISAGKYVKTGDRALQTGGNNSISIQKANLPNIKLKVDSFSLTTQQHDHPATVYWGDGWNDDHPNGTTFSTAGAGCSNTNTARTGKSGGQNTGTASPSTEALGSGNAITIQPEYITLKYWKRTS